MNEEVRITNNGTAKQEDLNSSFVFLNVLTSDFKVLSFNPYRENDYRNTKFEESLLYREDSMIM